MKYEPKPLTETADVSRGQTTNVDKLKFATTVVVVLGFGYLTLGLAADLVAANLPDRFEREWFNVSIPDADYDDQRLDHARTVFDQLKADPEIRPLNYRLFMLSLGSPNAVAVPGGGVGITPELLDVVKSDPGLAMVLGHELGHHKHRHTLKSMGRVLLRSIATALLFGTNDPIASTANTLSQRHHSRDAELEADEFGLRLMRRTMGDTKGAFEFFEWADTQEGTASRIGVWMRTHPLSEDRITRLKELDRQLQESPKP